MTFLPQAATGSASERLARGAQGLGFALILLFLLTVAGSFLPPQLLDPTWQLTLASNLTDNGAYPLFCEEAASDAALFANFKSHSDYAQIVTSFDHQQARALVPFIRKLAEEGLFCTLSANTCRVFN